jgi:nucleotide-binding universal stress UspA family protein
MIGSIVVGTDGSDTAAKAVAEAGGLASALGASVHVVSAFAPVSGTRLREEARQAPSDVEHSVNPREDVDALLEEAQEQLEEAGVTDVKTHAREGDAADALLDVAEEQKADLVVVGNKGMSGTRRFLLGSVPNKVSHHAPCSVLIVRTT